MGLSGTIKRGNYFRKSVELDGDTVITGGNFVLCHVTTNGYNLDIQGGNTRGLYIDGVKQDAYVWQRFEPYQLAVDILTATERKGGEEGVAIWSKALDEIFADPAIAYQDLMDAVDAWAVADPGDGYNVTNTHNIERAFQRLQGRFFPDMTYNQIKTELLSKSRGTWAGDATELVEEYS
jgi:hypothetical protein